MLPRINLFLLLFMNQIIYFLFLFLALIPCFICFINYIWVDKLFAVIKSSHLCHSNCSVSDIKIISLTSFFKLDKNKKTHLTRV